LSFFATFLWVGLGPTSVLEFGERRAAASLGPYFAAWVAKKRSFIVKLFLRLGQPIPDNLMEWLDVDPRRPAALGASATPLWMVTLLSTVAGTMGACIVPSALRFGRCYRLATVPPSWDTSESLGASRAGRAILHGSLIAPVLVVASFAEPLGVADLAPMLDVWRFRAILVAVWGALTLAAARTSIQSYLNTAVVAWHGTKHATHGSGDTSGKVAQRLRDVNEVINFFLHRVATQMVAPGALALAMSTLVMTAGSGAGQRAPSQGVYEMVMLSPEMADTLPTFVGFYACLTWALFSTLSLGMFQTGAITLEEYGR